MAVMGGVDLHRLSLVLLKMVILEGKVKAM